MAYGRRATPIHEKSMGSYELFAWRDAMAIADFLDETFGAAKARQIFVGIDRQMVVKFESENSSLIGDFIQKSEGQRPAFLRRVCKSADERVIILFIVLAILGVIRAKSVMELRDRFRTELAPGRGNRVTTASLYDFSSEIRGIYDYAWPWEVFDALGINDLDEDEVEVED